MLTKKCLTKFTIVMCGAVRGKFVQNKSVLTLNSAIVNWLRRTIEGSTRTDNLMHTDAIFQVLSIPNEKGTRRTKRREC